MQCVLCGALFEIIATARVSVFEILSNLKMLDCGALDRECGAFIEVLTNVELRMLVKRSLVCLP